jgi:hypothetical protein
MRRHHTNDGRFKFSPIYDVDIIQTTEGLKFVVFSAETRLGWAIGHELAWRFESDCADKEGRLVDGSGPFLRILSLMVASVIWGEPSVTVTPSLSRRRRCQWLAAGGHVAGHGTVCCQSPRLWGQVSITQRLWLTQTEATQQYITLPTLHSRY